MSLGQGRTGYYIEDQAVHRRELVYELGAVHGGAAVNVYRTLRDVTQEQRDPDGEILTGFGTLAAEAHVDVEDCRRWVGAMADLGLLDDLQVRSDGRRFVCRMSGWKSDQRRGSAALRQADKRALDALTEGEVTPERDPLSPNTKQSNTKNREKAIPVTYQGKPVSDDTVRVGLRLLAEFNVAADRKLGPTKATGQASDALKQIVGALLSRPEVTVDEWELAIANTIVSPPDWLDGRPVQLGDVFGPKAADHALSNTGKAKQSAGPVVPATGMCRECNRNPRMTGFAYCTSCRDELEAKLTGGPVAA